MPSYRFVHAADLHLDTPFEGLSRVSNELSDSLRDASLDAFDRLVEITLSCEAAFLLIAGDVYDGIARGVRAQLRLRRGLERLAAERIQVFIVHGNHDPIEGWTAVESWPDGVKIFASDEVEQVPVLRDGTELAQIYGISYPRREVSENLSLKFKRGEGSGLHIGLLHANVESNSEHGAYSPCTVSELSHAGMDYWALGHVHKSQVLREGSPWIVYPGNLQGRSPKPSERGAKGARVVSVENGIIRDCSFVPCDVIRFVGTNVDIADCSDISSLREKLLSEMERLRKEHDGRGLLIRAELSGRGPVYTELKKAGATEELLRDLREELSGESPMVWWERISNITGRELRLDEFAHREDFVGELVRAVESLQQDEDKRDAFFSDAWALEQKRRIVRKLGSPGSVEARSDALHQGMMLALDLLDDREDS